MVCICKTKPPVQQTAHSQNVQIVCENLQEHISLELRHGIRQEIPFFPHQPLDVSYYPLTQNFLEAYGKQIELQHLMDMEQLHLWLQEVQNLQNALNQSP